MSTIKPTYGTLANEHETQIRVMKKEIYFQKFLESEIPQSLKFKMTYSFTALGEFCIRCFFTLSKDFNESDMQELISLGKKLKSKRFSFEKFFRDDTGVFSYKLERRYKPYTDYIIFFENAPNIDGCEIKKKTIKKEIFYSDCGELTKKF